MTNKPQTLGVVVRRRGSTSGAAMEVVCLANKLLIPAVVSLCPLLLAGQAAAADMGSSFESMQAARSLETVANMADRSTVKITGSNAVPAAANDLVTNGGFENTTLISGQNYGSQIRVPDQIGNPNFPPGGQNPCHDGTDGQPVPFYRCGIEATVSGTGGTLHLPNSFGTSNFRSQARTWPVINNWTANGIVILFKDQPGTTSGTSADNFGAATQFSTPFKIYGPSSGSPNNGLRVSPQGGNFVALDGDSELNGKVQSQGEISQPLNNLQQGASYTVSFDWAAGQQATFPGDTMEQVRVSFCAPGQDPGPGVQIGEPGIGPKPGQVPFLPAGRVGSCSFALQVVDLPHTGFHPWTSQTVAFRAAGPMELLSFLALGAPSGGPPLVLLDNVSVTEVPAPEPGTWSLLVIGFVMAGIAWRRPKRPSVPA